MTDTAAIRAQLFAEELRAPTWISHGRLPLGNKRRPLDELIFILLTTMTQYGVTESYRAVESRFKPWRRLLAPDARQDLQLTIHQSGLSKQKAGNIVVIAAALQRYFGKVTLAPIRSMPTQDAEAGTFSIMRLFYKTSRYSSVPPQFG